jgi:20S proteasome subunit alpha 2
MDETTIEKVTRICNNIGMVYSGMGPDARVLLSKARKAAQQYKLVHGEEPSAHVLVKEVATVMQDFTQSGGVRPFGVSLLIAGYDDEQPMLYQVDPSGSYFAWKATAIGKNMVNSKTFLEKRYSDGLELDDAIHTAILTLKDSFEGQMTEDTIEIGVVLEPKALGTHGAAGVSQFRKLSKTEVKDYLANV